MLVWLASYPRSGNTYARVLLNKCLGLKTYSIHEGDDYNQETVAELIGHSHAANSMALLQEARNTENIFIVKTHHAPQSDEAAIYIVRDGRAATISFHHFCLDMGLEISIEQLIDGVQKIGSWSSHIAAWAPLERQNTLLVKYERLISEPRETITEISKFLGVSLTGQCDVSFEELNAMAPTIFRAGANEKNIMEMEPHIGKFFASHGAAMVGLKYVTISEAFSKLSEYLASLQDSKNIMLRLNDIKDILYTIEANSQLRYENTFNKLSETQPMAAPHSEPASQI